MTAKKKRGYSKAWPTTGERRVAINVDWVPPALKREALRKSKREGVSLRVKILGWLQAWVGGPTPPLA